MAWLAHRKWIAVLPSVVVFAALFQIIPFLLPDIRDNLSESYEPSKTLRFIASHGTYVHKWGPIPAFIFAPVYGAMLVLSKVGHHLSSLSGQYPFGFDDPVVQIGRLILAARITVLLIGMASIYYLCRSLQRALKNNLAPVVSLLMCLCTSLVFLEPLADTKPDGLMVSMLICALANYVAIVLDGLTVGNAVRFAFFYIASVSTKELTSTTMFLPFLGLMLVGLSHWRAKTVEGKQYVRRMFLAMACIPVFYLLINVFYAPSAWRERIAFVFGPLKDPAAWAAPDQTRLSYLQDTAAAVFAAIGWGGSIMLVVALIGTIRHPSRKLILLWLPFLSHLLFTTVLGGYMPAYFMLPLAPALALPVAFVLARALEPYLARPEYQTRLLTATAVLAACCAFMALSATTLFRVAHPNWMTDRAMLESVPPGSTFDPLKVLNVARTAATPGPDGRIEDHRPLFRLIQDSPQSRPQYLLFPTDLETWTMQIKDRPVRGAQVKVDTNFDYSTFRSFDSIGYILIGTARPTIPRWLFPVLVAGSKSYTEEGIHIYRLRSAPEAQPPHNTTASLP